MKRMLLILGLVAALAAASACGGGDGDDEEATKAPEPTTAAPTEAPQATAAATTDASEGPAAAKFNAAEATITVDGDNADWAAIEGATIPLKQIDIDELDPAQVADLEIDIGTLPPTNATLKVATDGTNIYVLVEVEDGFDYNPDPEMHNFSPALGVMFRIDEAAPASMGVEEEDLETSLGVVDIWHWELDCGPGQLSGGQGVAGGDDPAC